MAPRLLFALMLSEMEGPGWRLVLRHPSCEDFAMAVVDGGSAYAAFGPATYGSIRHSISSRVTEY